MLKKTWGSVIPALIATFSLALGFTSNSSAKAESEAQSNVQAKVQSSDSFLPNSSTDLKIDSRHSPVQSSPEFIVSQNINSPANQNSRLSTNPSTSVLKVGETRSQWIARSQGDSIAKIHAHKWQDRPAATVYVRNIPVLTFISVSDSGVDRNNPSRKLKSTNAVKLPSNSASSWSSSTAIPPELSDPIERATVAAALLNQLNRDGIDAAKITPAWQADKYSIKLGEKATIQFDRGLILPNSTNDKSEDTLQAANLLRRLMGNAEPVSKVTGESPASKKLASRPVAVNFAIGATKLLSGLASWYGPGFDGNMTANGERFNQYAFTAAHRSLPFGTKVRVTNVHNGQSVVVRITDRGPFEYSRIIDLSKGAAQVIGLLGAGIGSVKMEVLQASTN